MPSAHTQHPFPWNKILFTIMTFLHSLFFVLFLFPLSNASRSLDCSSSTCGDNKVLVRFPFSLLGKQPGICGYPGFNLTCTHHSNMILELPKSGKFFVRGIDYLNQQISLQDPENCLAKRILDFDASGSSFAPLKYQNYTFLSCPTQVIKSRYAAIDCLSNSTTSVLTVSRMELVGAMLPSCEIIKTLMVPVSWPVLYDEGFSTDLNDHDLRLTWSEPECVECEAEGAGCGFKNNNTLEVGCFPVTKSRSTSVGFQVFRILCLAIAAPAASCAIGIAIFACVSDKLNSRRQNSAAAAAAAVTPQPDITMMGLDETTIQSYEKLVLGESRRLPGPNDITCPICLSEYANKDTVRCVPECQHCFHADCIDEWLRMNNSCPVCRNSPSPVHSSQQEVV